MANITLASDSSLFLNDFGEIITYTPFNGTPKSITALINRNIAQRIPEAAGGIESGTEIFIRNDSTAGVQTISLGKDTVQFLNRLGDSTATSFLVTQAIEQDSGLWHLRVR